MMIEQLLTILKRGGAVTLDQIAREMDTTPEMITQLIGHLEHIGLLKQLGSNCDRVCSGCYLARECQRVRQPLIWQKIDQGE